MLGRIKVLLWTAAAAMMVAMPAAAKPAIMPQTDSRPVDLVIALDVSGSMSGLIESAKQRLWDIVNEIGQAQPRPDLRIAVLTYGNPSYGAQSGYVSLDLAFTRDLDTVMQKLFSFGTNGGDEYVARAVQTSINRLDWSMDRDALKIVFVAGNEGAGQDPLVPVLMATQAAASRGIVVNTIYCGNEQDNDAAGWREVASMTNGLFASIDMNAAAVANIATPMDQELTKLNAELNDTYVAYGKEGGRFKENQVTQDGNAVAMSVPSAAARAVAKAGTLYRNEQWDLVDAMDSGVAVEELDAEDLPEPMRGMSAPERKQYVEELARKREAISAQIAAVGAERQAYITSERAKKADADGEGLDEAILAGIREIAGRKGFEFDGSR